MSEGPGLGRIRIVGTGLIGTSIGLAARAAGVEVDLDDIDPERAATAESMGAGRRCFDGSPFADLVVIAAPPRVTARLVIDAIRREVGVTVTHTCSVQSQPQREIEQSLGSSAGFVGGHPIAGREQSGPEAADAELFRDRPWVVCPTGASSLAAVAAVTRLAGVCGAAPVEMSAGEHDRVFASLSHVPQLVASALAAALTDLAPTEVALAGPGLRDTTRIAESDPSLWAEVVGANPEAVAAGLRATLTPLTRLADALDADPTAAAVAVRALVTRGREGRALLPGKHGRAPAPWAVVPVVIPDRPGALADLLAAVAAEGVNLEDLRVEHAPGQPTGLAELAVDPVAREPLSTALRAAGWLVRPAADAVL